MKIDLETNMVYLVLFSSFIVLVINTIKTKRLKNKIKGFILQNTEVGIWAKSEELFEKIESIDDFKRVSVLLWNIVIYDLVSIGLIKQTRIPGSNNTRSVYLIQKLPN